LTVTLVAVDGALVQPNAVTVTVYAPVAVAMYACAVAPPIGLPLSYHCLPLALLEVSVTLSPSQNVVGPPGVMVGVAGIGLTVTVVAVEGALEQPFVVTTTV
jgi:hypothetical protein